MIWRISSRSQLADAVEVQLVTAEDVHDVLLEGEISAESFEAFLPESYAAGTLSALSSPVSAANRRTTNSALHAPSVPCNYAQMNAGVQFTPSRRRGITWYDADLESLSPIASGLQM